MLDEITWHNSSNLVFLRHFSLINAHIHKKSKLNDMEDANLHDIYLYGKF